MYCKGLVQYTAWTTNAQKSLGSMIGGYNAEADIAGNWPRLLGFMIEQVKALAGRFYQHPRLHNERYTKLNFFCEELKTIPYSKSEAQNPISLKMISLIPSEEGTLPLLSIGNTDRNPTTPNFLPSSDTEYKASQAPVRDQESETLVDEIENSVHPIKKVLRVNTNKIKSLPQSSTGQGETFPAMKNPAGISSNGRGSVEYGITGNIYNNGQDLGSINQDQAYQLLRQDKSTGGSLASQFRDVSSLGLSGQYEMGSSTMNLENNMNMKTGRNPDNNMILESNINQDRIDDADSATSFEDAFNLVTQDLGFGNKWPDPLASNLYMGQSMTGNLFNEMRSGNGNPQTGVGEEKEDIKGNPVPPTNNNPGYEEMNGLTEQDYDLDDFSWLYSS
ncbi:hypothetical protein ABW20_dc0106323 [Dactylellina cionopaga]|nr:hypothetical protein ABW20_dc0106323 [Dactylellina cionopaga]